MRLYRLKRKNDKIFDYNNDGLNVAWAHLFKAGKVTGEACALNDDVAAILLGERTDVPAPCSYKTSFKIEHSCVPFMITTLP